jgi:DNA-binding XRE family transcriptional regulator
MKLVAEHVVAARGMLKMSQSDLAMAAGVNRDTIQFFESGRTTPKDDTLFRIQTALEQRGIIFHNGGTPSVTLDRSKATIPT